MAQAVYSKGGRRADIRRLDDGRYVLEVDKRVEVSNHRNTFKEHEVMVKYLDWLFDKYEIREV